MADDTLGATDAEAAHMDIVDLQKRSRFATGCILVQEIRHTPERSKSKPEMRGRTVELRPAQSWSRQIH